MPCRQSLSPEDLDIYFLTPEPHLKLQQETRLYSREGEMEEGWEGADKT